MSGFEKFDMLASFASPQKTKRKRSSVKSKNSSEKPNKILKSSNNNISLLPLKTQDTGTSSKALDVSLVTRSTTALSRTNLEQKYDSPEKSMINNLSCNEDQFIFPRTSTKAYSPQIDDDDDSEPFQFTQEEIKIQKLPQSLNTRLLNRIQAFKSPSNSRPVQYGGMTEKFRSLIAKIKADNVKQLECSRYDEIKVNERKIRIISIAIRSNQVMCKFEFLDNDDNPMNGHENFMYLNSKIYGEILKSYQKFIVRVEHTVEIDENVSMHYCSHLRAC